MTRSSLAIACVALAAAGACTDDKQEDAKDAQVADAAADAGTTDASLEDAGLRGAALIERGRYLVENVGACADCHTPRKPDGSFDLTRSLAGVTCFMDVAPGDANAGCLSTRNLTNHETGLKNRSDQEIKDMFLKGIRPDGKALSPVMPYYVLGNMRDEDADAVVAYLRTVPAVDNMVGPSQPPFLPPPQPAPRWPEANIPRPRADYPELAAAERGRYLAGNIGVCMECHTARDQTGLPLFDKAFEGKNAFPTADLGLPPVFGEVIYAPNLTPHESGIANVTVDELVAAIKEGKDPNQDTPLCPPMPAGPMGAFAGISDQDARDIAHYLRAIPPKESVIPSDCEPPSPPTSQTRLHEQ